MFLLQEILLLPFMQRALLAGIILGFVLAFLGVFVTLKRMSFLGDGLAHTTLAGVALGVLAGINPLWLAFVVSIIAVTIIYFLERKTNISSDAIIGLIFTSGMALGVVLLSLKQGFQPDLISFLFGNILTINTTDLIFIALFSAIIIIFLIKFYKPLTLLILDRESASLLHKNIGALEFLFYIFLAIAIVLGIKMLGIILISALLIIPASTAKLFSASFKNLVINSILVSELIVILGLILSYWFDLPSGAIIILVGTFLFFITFVLKKLRLTSLKNFG